MRFLSVFESIIASVFLHLILVGLLFFFSPLVPQFESKTVTVDFISEQEDAIAQLKKIDQFQIVEQEEKSINNETPEEAKYLSRNNQTVKKQTVSANKGQFQNIKNKNLSQALNSGLQKMQKKIGQKSKPSLQDLTPKFDALAIKEKQQLDAAEANEKSVAASGASTSQTSDYFKDVDQGLETMLNTREFKYYTYYNRIRRQLSQYWEPKVKEKMNGLFHKGRRIASDHEHVTKLLIVLNEEGNLVKVQVLGASGIVDLDDAATEAFRSAAPFPNPPKGIVESDGTVKIRWDFILES